MAEFHKGLIICQSKNSLLNGKWWMGMPWWSGAITSHGKLELSNRSNLTFKRMTSHLLVGKVSWIGPLFTNSCKWMCNTLQFAILSVGLIWELKSHPETLKLWNSKTSCDLFSRKLRVFQLQRSKEMYQKNTFTTHSEHYIRKENE